MHEPKFIEYQKLVRDAIPDMIKADTGKKAHVRTLQKEEFLHALDKKLEEEVAEYIASHDTQELADILEVLNALLDAQGISMEAVEAIRLSKKAARGGFDKRVFLERVEIL